MHLLRAACTLHSALHLLELLLHCLSISAIYHQSQQLHLPLLVTALTATGITSLLSYISWCYRSGRSQNQARSSAIARIESAVLCALCHVAQCGLLWRVARLYYIPWRGRCTPAYEYSDLLMLRHLEGVLYSAPLALLHLRYAVINASYQPLIIATAVISIANCAAAISGAIFVAGGYFRRYIQTSPAFARNHMVVICGASFCTSRTLLVGSRVLCLAVFTAAYPYWAVVLVVTHTVGMYVWEMMVENQSPNGCHLFTHLETLGAAYTNVLDYLPSRARKNPHGGSIGKRTTGSGSSTKRTTIYYCIAGAENLGMLVAWILSVLSSSSGFASSANFGTVPRLTGHVTVIAMTTAAILCFVLGVCLRVLTSAQWTYLRKRCGGLGSSADFGATALVSHGGGASSRRGSTSSTSAFSASTSSSFHRGGDVHLAAAQYASNGVAGFHRQMALLPQLQYRPMSCQPRGHTGIATISHSIGAGGVPGFPDGYQLPTSHLMPPNANRFRSLPRHHATVAAAAANPANQNAPEKVLARGSTNRSKTANYENNTSLLRYSSHHASLPSLTTGNQGNERVQRARLETPLGFDNLDYWRQGERGEGGVEVTGGGTEVEDRDSAYSTQGSSSRSYRRKFVVTARRRSGGQSQNPTNTSRDTPETTNDTPENTSVAVEGAPRSPQHTPLGAPQWSGQQRLPGCRRHSDAGLTPLRRDECRPPIGHRTHQSRHSVALTDLAAAAPSTGGRMLPIADTSLDSATGIDENQTSGNCDIDASRLNQTYLSMKCCSGLSHQQDDYISMASQSPATAQHLVATPSPDLTPIHLPMDDRHRPVPHRSGVRNPAYPAAGPAVIPLKEKFKRYQHDYVNVFRAAMLTTARREELRGELEAYWSAGVDGARGGDEGTTDSSSDTSSSSSGDDSADLESHSAAVDEVRPTSTAKCYRRPAGAGGRMVEGSEVQYRIPPGLLSLLMAHPELRRAFQAYQVGASSGVDTKENYMNTTAVSQCVRSCCNGAGESDASPHGAGDVSTHRVDHSTSHFGDAADLADLDSSCLYGAGRRDVGYTSDGDIFTDGGESSSGSSSCPMTWPTSQHGKTMQLYAQLPKCAENSRQVVENWLRQHFTATTTLTTTTRNCDSDGISPTKHGAKNSVQKSRSPMKRMLAKAPRGIFESRDIVNSGGEAEIPRKYSGKHAPHQRRWKRHKRNRESAAVLSLCTFRARLAERRKKVDEIHFAAETENGGSSLQTYV